MTLRFNKKKDKFRPFNLEDFPYSNILIDIVQNFPPDLVLFANFCFAENVADILNINMKVYQRKESWYNSLEKLKRADLIKVKENAVNIHEIRPEEVSLLPKGKKVKKMLENTKFKDFLLELSTQYFRDNEEFINYFNSKVIYPKLKNLNPHIINYIEQTPKFKGVNIEDFFILISYNVYQNGDRTYRVYNPVEFSITCLYCGKKSSFQINYNKYEEYQREKKIFVKECKFCKNNKSRRRTKFLIKISKKMIKCIRFTIKDKKTFPKIHKNKSKNNYSIKERSLESIPRKKEIKENLYAQKKLDNPHIQLPKTEIIRKPQERNKKTHKSKKKKYMQNTTIEKNSISKDTLNPLKFSKVYQSEQIKFQKININTLEIKTLLYKICFESLTKQEVKTYLKKHQILKKIRNFAYSKKTQNLFFKFTKVAGRTFRFPDFCTLIGKFAHWNRLYRAQFSKSAPRMFKNMILKKSPSGVNYPIISSKMLKEYLKNFNNIKEIKIVRPREILQVFIDDVSNKYLAYNQFVKYFEFIVECIENQELKQKLLKEITK